MEFGRPTEFADYLMLLWTLPDFPPDLNLTVPQAFADAWKGLEFFLAHTPTEEGKEKLLQCKRNLHVAFEYSEKGDDNTAQDLVMETAELFKRCRKYIALSDE